MVMAEDSGTAAPLDEERDALAVTRYVAGGAGSDFVGCEQCVIARLTGEACSQHSPEHTP